MGARGRLGLSLFGLVTLAACVDLFHGTDFETLCARSPDDPQCGGAATDGAVGGSDGGAEADVADRPLPDFCAWTSSEAAKNAERACAWLTACVPPLGSTQIAECLVTAQLAYDCTANPNLRPRGLVEKAWGCLATASSCSEVDACVFPERRLGCQVAGGKGEAVSCGAGASASVRLRCTDTTVAGFDLCHLAGRTCGEPKVGALPECVPSATHCDGTRKCAGTIASDCAGIETVDIGVDCQFYGGGQCAQTAAGPGCVGTDGGACSLSEVTCEGTRAKACVGGKEILVDCALFGLPCATEDAGAIQPPPAPYAPWRLCASDACDPSQPASCVAGSVQACVRGAPRTVDCAAHGFGPCTESAGGVRCTPP